MTVLGVFGKGEARELGLGPDIIEAVRPRLSPFWIDSFYGCDKFTLTCANEIVTWGVNDNNDPDSDDDASLNPRASTSTDITASSFSPDTVFVQLAASGSCSFALTATGLVYAWGSFRTPEGEEALSRNPDSSAIVLRQPTPP
ncbi:ran exchange factor prp20 pim1 [Ophiostoma piceae UAMH 11346]|uniref:Ran exchange factor prp20 pim1 n=1 Tax=Ophiostoma piceae (strain UAMH 11346) TaxID=1262450 RepID=S3CDH1_OPHP1|nr:ran exchange factor prp20 pim1 [Ophiostoma piceae UAMH 11346]